MQGIFVDPGLNLEADVAEFPFIATLKLLDSMAFLTAAVEEVPADPAVDAMVTFTDWEAPFISGFRRGGTARANLFAQYISVFNLVFVG